MQDLTQYTTLEKEFMGIDDVRSMGIDDLEFILWADDEPVFIYVGYKPTFSEDERGVGVDFELFRLTSNRDLSKNEETHIKQLIAKQYDGFKHLIEEYVFND